MTGRHETYLGDAVYASFDGYMIQLRTDDSNNQLIFLEPATYEALVRFAQKAFAADAPARIDAAPDDRDSSPITANQPE